MNRTSSSNSIISNDRDVTIIAYRKWNIQHQARFSQCYIRSSIFGNLDDVARKAATIRYLQYLMKMSDGINFVYFIQMAYNAPIRHRAFNDATKSLVQGGKYFAGPSSEHDSTNYPGDQRIIGGDDSITIQLHHLYLDGAALDYAHEAYTLAINYPEQLAINYCANEANQDDDEEDDENEDA